MNEPLLERVLSHFCLKSKVFNQASVNKALSGCFCEDNQSAHLLMWQQWAVAAIISPGRVLNVSMELDIFETLKICNQYEYFSYLSVYM